MSDTATVLDGKLVAARIKKQLTLRVQSLAVAGVVPGLATVLVGEDPASRLYVDSKHRDCAEVGIRSVRVQLPGNATQAEILSVIDALNADASCTAFIVQLPLPDHVDTHVVLERIAPEKDEDGLHPVSLGRLVLGMPGPVPCTPRGIIELLTHHGVTLTGAQVCIIGCGLTVGRPLGLTRTH